MSYDFFMGLVAVASLVVSIIGIIKPNNAVHVSSKVINNYQTTINFKNSQKNNSRSSDPDEWIWFKCVLLLLSLMIGLYFYFLYLEISFLILSTINLVCIIVLFIFSRSEKSLSYIKYISTKLATLALTAIYIFLSQLKIFIPDGFDVKLLSSNTIDYNTLGTFIVSSIKIGIEGVKYTFWDAPFDIRCFLICRMFFLLVIIFYFIDTFISIYKMSKGKYIQYSNPKLIMKIILFNSICLILVTNIIYKVIPYIQAAFSF